MSGSERCTCFLRARVNPDETSIFVCSQLRNYTSTSVTNAVEEIFVKVVSELQKTGVFKLKRPHWYSLKGELNFAGIAARSRWVEYYPKGTGMSGEDSYALVSFDSEMCPVWNYVSLECAAKECGVEQVFFFIAPEDLEYQE